MIRSPSVSEQMTVSVFGSSRVPSGSPEYEDARTLGRELARHGLVVCSGGYGGVMEAVSRGAREAGGHAIGVTSSRFRSHANRWIDSEVRVPSWQERLFELVRRGNAYVVCPGGTGTLVELAVVWEMLSKRLMQSKPLAVLGSFWSPVIERVSQAEVRPSTEAATRGAQVLFHASSPAEAARYVAEKLHRSLSAE